MAAIVFDLDGTLVDSAPDLLGAANAVLAEAGRAPLDLQTLTRFIGDGMPKLVARMMEARGVEMVHHPAMLAAFRRHYDTALADATRPYPGAVAALDALREAGHALGICTNKPEGPARQVLGLLGLAARFDAVIGGDSLAAKKPDAAPLRAAFGPLGGTERLYVGDSEVDSATAEAAGVRFVLFTEGYRKRPVDEITHEAAFADFRVLPGVVEDLLAGG